LLRALSGDRAFLPPSRRDAKHHRQLTPASRRQDHTTSPSASSPLVGWQHRVHRIPHPTFVTIAKRPSYRVWDARASKGDLPVATTGRTAANWHDGQIRASCKKTSQVIPRASELWCVTSGNDEAGARHPIRSDTPTCSVAGMLILPGALAFCLSLPIMNPDDARVAASFGAFISARSGDIQRMPAQGGIVGALF
jgi:hypothetical protein